MKQLRFTDRAREDIAAILRFVAERSGDVAVGVEIADAVTAQCEKLAMLSGTMGRPRPELGPDLRSFPFRGYVIFFRYADDEMVVLNVLNSRRDIETYVADDD